MEGKAREPKDTMILGVVRGDKAKKGDGKGPIVGFIMNLCDGENKYISEEQAKKIGKFRNMEYNRQEKHWDNTENGKSRMPIYNVQAELVGPEKNNKPYIYIKERVESKGELLGFVLINAQGFEKEVKEDVMIRNIELFNIVNASVVNGKEIRGIKKPLKVTEYKPKGADKVQKPEPEIKLDVKPETKKQAIDKLVKLLNEASDAYYNRNDEIMSNLEYDKLYDKLERWEREEGYQPKDSPTRRVGYVVQSELEKKKHSRRMLSLEKTKELDELATFIGAREAYLSWKLDGITVIATYVDGELEDAVTRGNGNIGEVITENYKVFANVPKRIDAKGRVEVRGEGLISYETFERINKAIPDGAKYKNPRNLASGSIRQLKTEETAKRGVRFVAFDVVDGLEGMKHTEKLHMLKVLGFEVVDYIKVDGKEQLEKAVSLFKEKVEEYKYPTDGLVYKIDDIEEGIKLGETSRTPRNAIAFKWEDGLEETTLREVEWSNSRTGAINPVAIFDPVELEGTTVSRASLHNISILEELEIGIGDTITAYKANMIIPQIADNLTRSGTLEIPKTCGVCGGATAIRQTKLTEAEKARGEKPTRVLMCMNPSCRSKVSMRMVHFAGRDAANIDGLSEATLNRLLDAGVIENLVDIYKIKDRRADIINLEGMGVRSFERLVENIEKSRDIDLPHFLNSLGIQHLGRSNSAALSKAYEDDLTRVLNATEEELNKIDGIGKKMAESILRAFGNPQERAEIEELSKEFRIEKREFKAVVEDSKVAGKTFVVTGSVNHFKNRKEIENIIKEQGGKTSSSVTGKTDYLVNNDIESTSSKNKKAKELGTPIINEEQLIELLG